MNVIIAIKGVKHMSIIQLLVSSDQTIDVVCLYKSLMSVLMSNNIY